MTKVEFYFYINTVPSSKVASTAVQSISNDFFHVPNLQDASFTDSGKPVKVPDPTNHPEESTYFTFRSVVPGAIIDRHTLEISLSLEFSLRLP